MTNSYLLNPDFQTFKEHLLNIEKIFSSSDETIHKARNELKIIEIENIKYVVKSFKKPHLLNRIVYSFFRKSKAKKSYLNAIKLNSLDVATPTPVGIIEFFENKLLTQSYFVSLYQPYEFTIREVIHHKVEEYTKVLKEFAIFSSQIHKKGVWHEDYSLGNILISKEEDNYRFSLVDINRMQFLPIEPQKGLTNLNKLWIRDEEDMEILAYTYAEQREIDKELALKILKTEQQKIQKLKENKNFFKRLVGKK